MASTSTACPARRWRQVITPCTCRSTASRMARRAPVCNRRLTMRPADLDRCRPRRPSHPAVPRPRERRKADHRLADVGVAAGGFNLRRGRGRRAQSRDSACPELAANPGSAPPQPLARISPHTGLYLAAGHLGRERSRAPQHAHAHSGRHRLLPDEAGAQNQADATQRIAPNGTVADVFPAFRFDANGLAHFRMTADALGMNCSRSQRRASAVTARWCPRQESNLRPTA